MPLPPSRTKKDLAQTITGFDTALEGLARLYTNEGLTHDYVAYVREVYTKVTEFRNAIADISRQTPET